MKTWLLIGCCALALSSQLLAEESGVRRLALIVAASDGGEGRAWLRYAVSDANAVARVLGELGRVTDEDLLLLYDPEVAELERTLKLVRGQVQALQQGGVDVELLFYYSGHSDEHGLLLGKQRLDYATLKQGLHDIPAKTLIAVVDSCASGAFVKLKGGQKISGFLAPTSEQVEGRAYVSSASISEAAQESSRLGGSFFTHYLVTGLRGAADGNSDARVTLHEAYDYAYHTTLAATERTYAGAQHASYAFELQGTGQLVLTELDARHGALLIDTAIGGRLSVRDSKGYTVIELLADAPQGRRLALGVGSHEAWLRKSDGLYRARFDVKLNAEQQLSALDFARVKQERTALRGVLPELSQRGREQAQAEYAARRIVWKKQLWSSMPVYGVREVPLLEEALYAHVDRYDLWRDMRDAKTRRQNLAGASALLMLTGATVGMIWPVLDSLNWRPSSDEQAVALIAATTGGLLMIMTGATGGVLMAVPTDPLNDDERRALVETYNAELRRELGLEEE